MLPMRIARGCTRFRGEARDPRCDGEAPVEARGSVRERAGAEYNHLVYKTSAKYRLRGTKTVTTSREHGLKC